MKTSTTTAWILGAVALALALVAGGWFLLVGPTLSTASSTRQQAVGVEDSNLALTAKIATLKKQFKEIDTYKADLAALRAQVPATADTANLLRGLQAAAQASGVTLISVTPGTPVAATVAQAAAASELSGAGVTSDQSSSGSATPSATADSATSKSSTSTGAGTTGGGLVALPLQIDVLGGYAATVAFLDQIQSTTGRSYFVTSIGMTAQKDAPASAGRPATTVGDSEIQLSGYVFVLPESTTTPAANPSATPTPLPAAIPGKNPLVPVG